MEIVASEMFTLCADDLVVGLGLLSPLSTTLEFMCTDVIDVDDLVVGLGLLATSPTTLEFMCTDIIEVDDSSVGVLTSLVLLCLLSTFPTTLDFKTMVVLGRGESWCTDVIDVDNGDGDNDDDDGKCDNVENAARDGKPGAEH